MKRVLVHGYFRANLGDDLFLRALAMRYPKVKFYFPTTRCDYKELFQDLPNVKKKFYKANLQVRGSGIGLAVVDEIVRLHNGVFEINSVEGVGTTVTVVFPIERVPVEQPTSLIEEMMVSENNE